MDYRDNLYPKIPFYMTYPMQNMYLTEMEYEKDIERMKSYYPSETKAIMKMVEDRLDELEYEGSRIYDEEPDRMMIQMEVEQLYRKLMEESKPEKIRNPASPTMSVVLRPNRAKNLPTNKRPTKVPTINRPETKPACAVVAPSSATA